MKRVYASEFLAEIGHYKNLLDQAGIPAVIKNVQLSGAIGEIPFLECQPELWVLDDAASPAAERIIAEASTDAPVAQDWRCGGCGERIEGQFAACWRCGRAAEERT